MRVLDRYLIRGFLGVFIYCLLLFTVIFIVIDSFNKLDEFLKNGVSIGIIATYYFYALPSLLAHIVPISMLMAILYKLGNLNRHNEIVALKASGVSAFQIILPYIFMGVLVSFVVFLVNETVVPQASVTSASILEGLIEKGKKNLNERAIKNVTLYGADKRMIFAREYEIPTESLYDVVMLQEGRNLSTHSKLIAKNAHYHDGQWTFHEAIGYDLNHQGEIVGEPQFYPSLDVEMEEKPADFIKGSSQMEFMSARQLHNYIGHFEGSSRQVVRRLWVDFHYKIAFPFVSFIVMLIGAPLAMRTERAGAFVGVGTGLIVVLLYYGVNSVCLAFGKGGILDPFVAAWFSNALFASAGVYLIKNTS